MEAAKKKEQNKAKGADELMAALLSGKTFSDLHGFDENSLEAVYHFAYTMYEGGQLDKAITLFKFLCFQDHLSPKFFLGLAACQQMQKDYKAAIHSYSYAAVLDVSNPNAPLQAANCHLALLQYEQAASGYYAAQHLAKGKPEYADLAAFAKVREEAMRLKLKAKKSPVHKGAE